MKRFNGYEEVKENNFDRERLKLGAHLLKITDVKIQKFTSSDGSNFFEQLQILFDITEPDEQAGFYKRRYAEDVEKDATNAKWKGIYRLNIPKDDGSELDEGNKVKFKTFITCVEKSNSGYDWEKSDWDEKTLKGKLFGGIFSIKEFETLTGETAYTIECRFPRTVDAIKQIWKDIENGKEFKLPKVRLVDKTYIEYDEWVERRKAQKENNNSETTVNVIDDNDDLPF